ncbi:MAG: hypothetical protein ACRDAU_02790 [Clostridium sp.]
MYIEILNTPVFSSIACILLFIIIISFKYNISLDFKNHNLRLISVKYFRIIVFVFSFIFLISGVYYGSKKLRLPEVVKSYFSDSAYIKNNYVDPRNVKMEFPKKKRNLIHIYLESVESSYFSKELGGYMDVNLMPELATLSKEGVKFIKWIQKQPFYENTTIVVTGDHLSMDKNFFKNWDPNYRRSVFNLILNADPATTNKNVDNLKNRAFSPVDFYPTILASMGVNIEGNRLGLGTNMFSNEKTLIERDGLKTFDSSLGEKSNFFNDSFISEDKNSTFSNNLVTYR